MTRYGWHIDRFDSTLHVKRNRRDSDGTYAAVKAAALAAGRFSTFEASEHPSDFNQLVRDPEVETFDLGYPWIGVRRRLESPPTDDPELRAGAVDAGADGV